MTKKNTLKIRLANNKKEVDYVMKIREIVFIKGQKVPKKRELDGFDENAKHVIVIYKKTPIGCARIRFLHNKAKLERIALLKQYRGRGFGKNIIKYLVSYCKRKNPKEIVMHAQYYLKDFYNKCGFEERGSIFMDAGIRHIEMYMPAKNKKNI